MQAKLHSRVGRRIHRELDAAKQLLEAITPAISIYGGARVKPTDPAYAAARELARRASSRAISVIAGGGPGIMEAANLGCQEGLNGTSVGLNISLPFEQQPNPYQDLAITFEHFAARKVAFSKYSMVFVAFEGGFGTLDEVFEVLTLIQTGKMPEIPVLLYGRKFWSGLVAWMDEMMLQRGLLSKEDLSRRVRIVDSADEAMEVIESQLEKNLPARAA
jgi:uncharacterized protein (TIGR00730 family)